MDVGAGSGVRFGDGVAGHWSGGGGGCEDVRVWDEGGVYAFLGTKLCAARYWG